MQEKISTTEQVYQAVCELHSAQQPVTRYSVTELTGLPMGKVDDRLKTLAEQERIKRVLRGQYVPIVQHDAPRAISKTLLPDGTAKYEIGDIVLTLTPAEDRMLSSLTAGPAAMVVQIEAARGMAEVAEVVQGKLQRIEQHLKINPTLEIAAGMARTARTLERITAAALARGVQEGADQLALPDV